MSPGWCPWELTQVPSLSLCDPTHSFHFCFSRQKRAGLRPHPAPPPAPLPSPCACPLLSLGLCPNSLAPQDPPTALWSRGPTAAKPGPYLGRQMPGAPPPKKEEAACPLPGSCPAQAPALDQPSVRPGLYPTPQCRPLPGPPSLCLASTPTPNVDPSLAPALPDAPSFSPPVPSQGHRPGPFTTVPGPPPTLLARPLGACGPSGADESPGHTRVIWVNHHRQGHGEPVGKMGTGLPPPACPQGQSVSS